MDEFNDFYQEIYLPQIREFNSAISKLNSQVNNLQEELRKLKLRQTRTENK